MRYSNRFSALKSPIEILRGREKMDPSENWLRRGDLILIRSRKK